MAFLEQRDPVFKLYSFEKEDQKIKTKRKWYFGGKNEQRVIRRN
jgi:hypothetical protein